MSNDTLQMDGKTYISSGGAAQLVGYTKDYVGQLARAGKLEAKLIGRSWYISKESIKEHKESVNYTLTKPKKKRQNVSRVPESSSKHMVNSSMTDSSISAKSTKSPVKREYVQDSSEDLNVSLVSKSDESDVLERRRKTYTKGNEVLVDSDIEFEVVEPVFYEDDRPAIPQPKRTERFENVPITKPHRSLPEQKPEPTPVAERSYRRSIKHTQGVPVDGVRMQRPVPVRTRGQSAVVHEPRVAMVQNLPSTHEKRRGHSKAVPVLGSIVLFALFAVWHTLSR